MKIPKHWVMWQTNGSADVCPNHAPAMGKCLAGQFTPLFGQSDSYLKRAGAIRQTVDSYPGYPDRISLCEIPAGENSILINHIYQPANTPYFGSHAIFVWEGCTKQGVYINELPEVMKTRVLSLRAYDSKHFLMQADICEGKFAENLISRFLTIR